MMQQPLMSGGIDAGSPITFPEEHEDPRVTVDTGAGGGIWGFFKVLQVTSAHTSMNSPGCPLTSFSTTNLLIPLHWVRFQNKIKDFTLTLTLTFECYTNRHVKHYVARKKKKHKSLTGFTRDCRFFLFSVKDPS